MRYSVIVHRADEGGYWVEVPALPGCYSQGDTIDQTLEKAAEGVELYLETLREEGRAIPRDEDVVFQVTVAV